MKPKKTDSVTRRPVTPLAVITSFLTLTELIATVALLNAVGGVRIALTWFVLGFPSLTMVGFFAVLWKKAYVFYPPAEFGPGTDVGKFVNAMRDAPQIKPADPMQDQEEIPKDAEQLSVQTATQQFSLKKAWYEYWDAKEYDLAVEALIDQARAGERDLGIALGLSGHILTERSKDEGLAFWANAIREHPREAEPYIWSANYYANLSAFDKAIAIVDSGIAAAADEVQLSIAKARYLRQASRRDQAVGLLRELVDRMPTNVAAETALAELYSALEDHENAVGAARRVLKLDPINESALDMLGRRALAEGKHQVGLEIYRRLVVIAPMNPTYWGYLGNALLAAGLPGGSLEAYDRANELAQGKQAWILANIGNLLKNQGFHQRAIRYLKEAIVLDPDSSYAHDRLAQALKGAADEEANEVKLLSPPAS